MQTPSHLAGFESRRLQKIGSNFFFKVLALQCYLGILVRYMLCYFKCNEYLVSDIWDVSLYNVQFREIKVDEYLFFLIQGIKWKIWTLFFHWNPLMFCKLSSLDTTASQGQATFFKKLQNAENWQLLLNSITQFFYTFLPNGCHS